MPGPDPRKNRKQGIKMGPTTFFVGKDGNTSESMKKALKDKKND